VRSSASCTRSAAPTSGFGKPSRPRTLEASAGRGAGAIRHTRSTRGDVSAEREGKDYAPGGLSGRAELLAPASVRDGHRSRGSFAPSPSMRAATFVAAFGRWKESRSAPTGLTYELFVTDVTGESVAPVRIPASDRYRRIGLQLRPARTGARHRRGRINLTGNAVRKESRLACVRTQARPSGPRVVFAGR